MLVLSRAVDEGITIDLTPDVLEKLLKENGCTIHIMVTRLTHNRAKLGFEAPQSVRIVRDEVMFAEAAADK